jgi:hypothetical protein
MQQDANSYAFKHKAPITAENGSESLTSFLLVVVNGWQFASWAVSEGT